VTFNHTGITGNCVSCHNGTTATGKAPNHIPTSASCEVCHTTRAWIPASFSHQGITSNCASCHNGVTATGKGTSHFLTTLSCESCHNSNAWTPIRFMHSSPNYPGDHRNNLTCNRCHQSNSQVASWSFPQYQPDCAGCHAGDFKADSHKKSENPTIRYTASELRDCTGSCHLYTDGTFTTISRTRSAQHRVTSGDW
jgi:hypothetical protein